MEDIPYDKRLAPHVIDIRAAREPNKIYAILPSGKTFEDGFSELTYGTLASAVDTAAWWLDEVLGGPESGDGKGQTFPYIGADDFRYVILVFAAIKSRRQFMAPIDMNTPEGLAKLLEASSVRTVLASKSHARRWDAALALSDGIRRIEVPELSYFLETKAAGAYPYDRTYPEALHDTMMVIQTSGTTGTPKPITMTGHSLQVYRDMWMESKCGPPDQQLAYPELQYKAHVPILIPISWGASLATCTTFTLVYELVPILLPSPPSPMTVEYAHQATLLCPRGERNGIIFVPFVLHPLVKEKEKLEALSRYDWVAYAGAPLDQAAGDAISEYARVQSFAGSTDISVYPLLLDEPQDWNLHRFHAMNGFHFQHFDQDLYELCVRRVPDEHRHCFLTSPDPNLQVHHTRDLYRAVPGREGYYTTAGRIDDFIKLLSLTKLNTVNIERLLDGHVDIAGSLVAGNGRPRAFVIIQPNETLRANVPDEEKMKERIWPAIEAANKTIFGDAKLDRDMIIIAPEDMPIRRTAKGTIDRRNTLLAYESMIEKLYQ